MTASQVPVTVVIAARNEEANLPRCLASTKRAARVIVVDSRSEDRTRQIAEENGAEVHDFEYKGGYPKKRQWALDTVDIATDWVLLLDADESVPDALWNEIADAIGCGQFDGYLVTKRFHFLGQRFRFGGFSHKAVLLFKKGFARFERLGSSVLTPQDMEVHERLLVNGRIGSLRNWVLHDDFKGLTAYVEKHNHYATWEASVRFNYLHGTANDADSVRASLFGNTQERRRFLKLVAMRVPFEPALWFLYHYVAALGFLEGRRGLIAAEVRRSYIAQVRAKVYELKLQQASHLRGGLDR